MLLGLMNQALWLTFGASPAATARRYAISEGAVSYIAISSNVLFLPGSWIGAQIVKRKGLCRSIVVAGWLQIIGSVLRYLADLLVRPISGPLAFFFIFVGQGLTAIAAPLVMNTPASFAEAWFGRKEREAAVAAGTFSPIFGQGVGAAVAGFMVSGPEAEGTQQLLAGQAAVSCIVGAWTVCCFRIPPPTRQPSSEAKISTCTQWSKLMCRPNFVLILIIFDCGLGLAAAVLTLFGRLAEDCGYTASNSGIASGLYMLGGMAGSLGAGLLLGATGAYSRMVRLTVTLAVLGGFLFLLTLQPDNLGHLLAATTFFGLFMMSALPALVSSAVEETYPLPADASTGLLFISAVALQVALTPLAQLMLETQNDRCSSWGSPFSLFVTGVAVVGCLLPALVYRGKNNRTLAEEEEVERLSASIIDS